MSKFVSFKSLLFLFIAGLGLCSCGFGAAPKKITVAGSTTILPISEDWASDYNRKTRVIVNVQGGGSTNGIALVKAGRVDIGASSRILTDDEERGLKKYEIGKDAIAVVVNPKNQIDDLTTVQLKKIFSGEIKNWKALGGPDLPIQVVNRESGSGSRSTFEELVMCPHHEDKKLCPEMMLSAIVVNSNAEVKRTVELIPDSIGYLSFGFLDEKIKPLSLDGVSPLEEEVRAGNYPLARGLFYLVKEGNNSKEISNFLQFVMSPEAQLILSREGFMAVR